MEGVPKPLLLTLGFILLVAAIIGAMLPGVPGVVFLGLAVICFKKSWPRFDIWLHQLPYVGTELANWEKNKSIAMRTKVVTVVMFFCTVPPSFYFFVSSDMGRVLTLLVSLSMCAFILTRPTAKKENAASE